jgi:hypothetical protein
MIFSRACRFRFGGRVQIVEQDHPPAELPGGLQQAVGLGQKSKPKSWIGGLTKRILVS